MRLQMDREMALGQEQGTRRGVPVYGEQDGCRALMLGEQHVPELIS